MRPPAAIRARPGSRRRHPGPADRLDSIFAVNQRQPLLDVGEADAAAATSSACALCRYRPPRAAIVRRRQLRLMRDAGRRRRAGDAIFDRILDDRLQDQRRHQRALQLIGHVELDRPGPDSAAARSPDSCAAARPRARAGSCAVGSAARPRRRKRASLTTISSAFSLSLSRISADTELRLLNRKCGLIWLCSARSWATCAAPGARPNGAAPPGRRSCT